MALLDLIIYQIFRTLLKVLGLEIGFFLSTDERGDYLWCEMVKGYHRDDFEEIVWSVENSFTNLFEVIVNDLEKQFMNLLMLERPLKG